MANTNPAHIVLCNVRLSYANLTTPRSINGGEAKYSATILVPKASNQKVLIDTAIKVATEAAKAKHGQAFPMQPKHNVYDGDGVKPSDNQPFGAECKGHWVFTASNKLKPTIVDGNMQEILNPTEIYSGMYANVGLDFFGYNAPQNKGISASIVNVQKVSDGEPLGGARVSAEDDFTSLGQPTQPPPQYQQPTQYPNNNGTSLL